MADTGSAAGSAPAIEAWRSLGGAVDALGQAEFERVIHQWVATIAPVSVLFAIEIFDDDRPGRVVITQGSDDSLTVRARKISRDYAVEDYAADDILRARRANRPREVDMVVQHGADREQGFRVKYFESMDAPVELSAFECNGESMLYLGASSFHDGYSDDEIRRLSAVMPLVLSLVRRHAALGGSREEGQRPGAAQREETIRRLLLTQSHDLTQREAEVCAAIVMGYRAETIAERLGISPNTVATHRKRAYAKLRISSQTELFGQLFAGWSAWPYRGKVSRQEMG